MAKRLIAVPVALAVLGAAGVYVAGTVRSGASFPTRSAAPRRSEYHPLPARPARSPMGRGQVWFVDAARGSDSNDGRSDRTAFRSLRRAIDGTDAPIGPGDTVLVRGGRYRERVVVRKGGTPGDRVLIAAQGDEEVVLDASRLVTGWTPHSGAVYRSRPGFTVSAVVVDGQPLVPEPTAALREGSWHYRAVSGELYLWAPGGGDPSGRDVGVIADDPGQDGILVEDASHLTVSGLTVRFAGGHGISILGDHVRVERCTLEFNGKAGVNVFAYGSTDSVGAMVVGNDIHWNVMRNWPRGRMKWGGWAMGAVSNGTPGILYEGNVSHDNGGEGLGAYVGPGGSVFRGNVVYDNWSVNIYVDNQPDAVVERNFVYAGEPDPGALRNNGDADPGDGRNLRRLRPIGILTGDEKYSLDPPANLRGVLIANNVIVNCRRGIHHYAAARGSGLRDVRVLHNTIVVADAEGPGEDFVGIGVPYNDGNNRGSVYLDNIVLARHPRTYLLYSDGPPGEADAFTGLRIESNLWHHAGRANGFHWGPDGARRYDLTHPEWRALPGAAHGAGDVLADPRLVAPAGACALDLRPSPTSPAVDAGVDAGIRLDFSGGVRPVNGRYDLGAFELGAVPPGPSSSSPCR